MAFFQTSTLGLALCAAIIGTAQTSVHAKGNDMKVATSYSLQTLSDRAEIQERLARWPDIVDSMKLDLLPEVFQPDVVWDFGGGTVEYSLAAVRKKIEGHLGDNAPTFCGHTRHDLSNMMIDVDGDKARSKVNVFASHEGVGPYAGKILYIWLTYTDDWVRTANGWRIGHREYRIQFMNGPKEIVYGDDSPPIDPSQILKK